jgi:hypothetical protein
MVTNLFTDVSEERAAIVFKLEAEDSILHGEVFLLQCYHCPDLTALLVRLDHDDVLMFVIDPTFQRQSVSRRCGLVVRVLGHKSRGPGSIPGATRFS